MTDSEGPIGAAQFDLDELKHSLRRPRTLFDVMLTMSAGAVTLVALFPLFSVLYLLIVRGGAQLRLGLFTELPPRGVGAETVLDNPGGFGNCILGTVIMVGLAALIAIPFGILAGVFLAEFGKESRTAGIVRFCAKTLTGLPSILAGVFAFIVVVSFTGYSALAGGVALALLMIPTITLTAEEAIKMVPQKMKDAAIGMGCTPTQVTLKVTLPTAFPGILTGVMLAVARSAGETAPLLFTALFSNYWFNWKDPGELIEPTASMAVLIYNFAGSAYPNWPPMAWACALVLVTIVMTLNITAQLISRRQTTR